MAVTKRPKRLRVSTVLRGPRGPAGSAGSAGSQGPQGLIGDVGPQGPTGSQGPQGLAGDVGPQGETGSQGPAGNVGPQGIQGIPGVGANFAQTEVDFGAVAKRSASFTVVNALILPTSKILALQAGDAATGKSADENELDTISFRAVPATGQFTLYAQSTTGLVSGKFMVNYLF